MAADGTPDRSSDRPDGTQGVTGGHTVDLPDSLHLRVGQVVRVPLHGASGAGHRWRVHQVPAEEGSSSPASVSVEVGTVTHLGGSPGGAPPANTSAPEVLVVEARGPGRVEVELRLARSWAPDEPLALHRLSVVVDG